MAKIEIAGSFTMDPNNANYGRAILAMVEVPDCLDCGGDILAIRQGYTAYRVLGINRDGEVCESMEDEGDTAGPEYRCADCGTDYDMEG